ncbi:hypothetical protein ABIE65_005313 [Constrictibacter sp. MBR-5]|jgi:hypothetical protein
MVGGLLPLAEELIVFADWTLARHPGDDVEIWRS